jgi:protein-S-isoprenylcysteine O-methyltransferase Ste14
VSDPQATSSQRSWSRIARRIRVPLGFLFAAFYFWRARPTWMSLLLGMLVVVTGILLRAIASGQVRKNEELTMSGPYAYVRNPLYLGSITLGLGFAMAARDLWVLVVISLLFVLIYLPVIRSEESFLRSRFSSYDDYARRVPSLLPGTLRLRNLMTGFSRELYLRHREYNALLGAVAMFAALSAKIVWMRRGD